MGKSVLAAWIVRQEETKTRFGKRMVWIQSRKAVTRKQLLHQVARRALGVDWNEERSGKGDEKQATVEEEDIFGLFDDFFRGEIGRPMLFVVDDVWHEEDIALIQKAIRSPVPWY